MRGPHTGGRAGRRCSGVPVGAHRSAARATGRPRRRTPAPSGPAAVAARICSMRAAMPPVSLRALPHVRPPTRADGHGAATVGPPHATVIRAHAGPPPGGTGIAGRIARALRRSPRMALAAGRGMRERRPHWARRPSRSRSARSPSSAALGGDVWDAWLVAIDALSGVATVFAGLAPGWRGRTRAPGRRWWAIGGLWFLGAFGYGADMAWSTSSASRSRAGTTSC